MQLNLPLGKVIEMVEGSSALDHSFLLSSLTSLEAAGPQDIAVVIPRGDASVFDGVARKAIENCKAGIIVASKPIVGGKQYLIVKDPLEAYHRLVQAAQQGGDDDQVSPDFPHAFVSSQADVATSARIEPGVVVKTGAKIGNNAVVGAHCVVGRGAVLGSNVLLHPHTTVLDHCSVGNRSIIHSGTVIGSDGFGYQVTKTGMKKIPQIGTVFIGDDVEIGANCSIDRAAFDKTYIGNGVKIDNNVHIAHGVIVGDHTAILAQTGIAGSVKIGFGCQIGGHVAIKDHITIGNQVKIVSKSAVVKSIKDKAVVGGMPAIEFKQWRRIVIATLKLPELFKKASEIEALVKQRRQPWFARFFSKK